MAIIYLIAVISARWPHAAIGRSVSQPFSVSAGAVGIGVLKWSEGVDHRGGTCVNTGCTPTKAIVASAYAGRIARRAAEYGVAIGG